MAKNGKKWQKMAKKWPKKWQKRPKKAAKKGKKKICDSPPLFWRKKFDFSVVFSPPSKFVFFKKSKIGCVLGAKSMFQANKSVWGIAFSGK